jgi:hypothetical protein
MEEKQTMNLTTRRQPRAINRSPESLAMHTNESRVENPSPSLLRKTEFEIA